MKKVASLRYGVIFKKAFCDVDVFKGFVRDILGINLEIDHVETEKSFKPSLGHVEVKYDLYAEDKKNRIIVDIQHQRHSDHYHRFLHYHCIALLEQIKSAINYEPPLAVYTIVVLTSGDKHKCDVSVIDFDPKDLQGKSLNEIPHKIIYICPKYLNDNTPEHYKEWLRVIDDSLDGEIEEQDYQLAEIQKILIHIEENDVSPREKARMIDEAHIEEMESTAFDKGVEVGMKERDTEMTKKMLQQGLEIEVVSKITGLDIKLIQSLNDAEKSND